MLIQKPSEKNYAVAVCLSGIFGIIGVHHFYLGRVGMGLLDFSLTFFAVMMFIFETPVLGIILLLIDIIHTIIVTIMLLIGRYKDGRGRFVCYPGQLLSST